MKQLGYSCAQIYVHGPHGGNARGLRGLGLIEPREQAVALPSEAIEAVGKHPLHENVDEAWLIELPPCT
jgi:hypothetical protein